MIELKKPTKAVWVEYPDDKDVRFLIRPFLLSEFGTLRSKLRKKIAIESSKGMEIVDDVDEFELSRLVFVHSLEDWEGLSVKGENGEDLSKEEQKMVIFNHSELMGFIVDKANELGGTVAVLQKEEEKNSPSSQSG